MALPKYEIERYIEDWHWDEKSYAFAWALGVFLFKFMDYLKLSGASESTLSKHESNVWNIGIFTCQYGYHEKFEPGIFKYPPFHDIEFKRKVSDSQYAIKSYESTCNKLAKYVKAKSWDTFEGLPLDLTDEMKDFLIGLRLLERSTWRLVKTTPIDFTKEIKAIRQYFAAAWSKADGWQQSLAQCNQVFNDTILKVEGLAFEDDKFRDRIKRSLLGDAPGLAKRLDASCQG
jgi:hypothetical protein